MKQDLLPSLSNESVDITNSNIPPSNSNNYTDQSIYNTSVETFLGINTISSSNENPDSKYIEQSIDEDIVVSATSSNKVEIVVGDVSKNIILPTTYSINGVDMDFKEYQQIFRYADILKDGKIFPTI